MSCLAMAARFTLYLLDCIVLGMNKHKYGVVWRLSRGRVELFSSP